MTTDPGARMPHARSAALVVERLADETLVYDLKRHRAHCLNPAATLVWHACDGRTSVAATAMRLERELGLPAGEALVWSGLDQLARARLLQESRTPAAPRARPSRREVLRTLGLSAAAAVLAPLVDSIVSPVAAQAGSCLTSVECETLLPGACTGQSICGDPDSCCMLRGQRCRARKC